MIDEKKFASFYEQTKHALWLYVAGMMREDSRADDIFQETYIRFLQSNVEHKSEVHMKSYLYRIATNLMRDHWRKQKRERRWFAPEEENAPSKSDANSIELQHDLSSALDCLAPQQRSMVWLAYVEEYSHKEIAEMLNLREKSVKVLLYRAKQKLGKLFKRKGITPEMVS